MTVEKISLAEKFSQIDKPWTPRIAGRVNDCDVKLAKIEGEFVWHSHADEDEMFLVVKGRMTMRFRDGEQVLGPGEIIIVPRGVEHMPVADPGTEIVMVEPAGTLNTGNVVNDRTVADPDAI